MEDMGFILLSNESKVVGKSANRSVQSWIGLFDLILLASLLILAALWIPKWIAVYQKMLLWMKIFIY